jgi:hypothetical protein
LVGLESGVIGERGEKLRRLKDSIPFLYKNSNELYNVRHFAAFFDGVIHLKKPSGGPKGLIGSPCHGAPWPPEAKKKGRLEACQAHFMPALIYTAIF